MFVKHFGLLFVVGFIIQYAYAMGVVATGVRIVNPIWNWGPIEWECVKIILPFTLMLAIWTFYRTHCYYKEVK